MVRHINVRYKGDTHDTSVVAGPVWPAAGEEQAVLDWSETRWDHLDLRDHRQGDQVAPSRAAASEHTQAAAEAGAERTRLAEGAAHTDQAAARHTRRAGHRD